MGNFFNKKKYYVNNNDRLLLYENITERIESIEQNMGIINNNLKTLQINYSNSVLNNNGGLSSLNKDINDIRNDNIKNQTYIRTLNIVTDKNSKDIITINSIIEDLKQKEEFNSIYTEPRDSLENSLNICLNKSLSID
jgi:hypothetical protein